MDLVEQLRGIDCSWNDEGEIAAAAADEIERLTKALHGKAEALMMQTNEIERLREERNAQQQFADKYYKKMNEALGHLAACQKDAERYRWLRVQGVEFLEWWADRTPEEGDAAIDAAMKEKS